MGRLLLSILLLVWLPLQAAPVWQKLEGCQLIANPANDGDPFHVGHNCKEYIFRLYFVDACEVSTRFPDRLKDQAGYFGITPEQAVELGKQAKEFSLVQLSRGPFTVWTCWQTAPGASKLPRTYGIVILSNGRWLDRELVRRGLARIYGKRVQLPGGESSRWYLDFLQGLEGSAKAGGIGGWSQNTMDPKQEIAHKDR